MENGTAGRFLLSRRGIGVIALHDFWASTVGVAWWRDEASSDLSPLRTPPPRPLLTLPEMRQMVNEPYYCSDCGRRFYNLGWHAEACGSSNYERMTDYWERLQQLREDKKRLEAETK